MKLILREDVQKLGRTGDIVTVKDGYGRNFLLPRKMAVMANEKNLRQMEHEKAVIASRQEKLKGQADAQAQSLQAIELTFRRKIGEQGKLFGSVTALDIAEALAAQGQRLDRRAIHLPEPIKVIGKHEVEARLHREVTAKLRIEVVPE